MSELHAILADVETAEANLARARARLTDYITAKVPRQKAYKNMMGNLTEEGVRVCNAAFARDESPTDIANLLGITVSAVIYRQKQWRRRKAREAAQAQAA